MSDIKTRLEQHRDEIFTKHKPDAIGTTHDIAQSNGVELGADAFIPLLVQAYNALDFYSRANLIDFDDDNGMIADEIIEQIDKAIE